MKTGGGDLSALKTRIAELYKEHSTVIMQIAKNAAGEFAPHQKAISALLPRLQKAQKGETVEFSEAEKAQLQSAAKAGEKLLSLSGIFPAAIAEQLKTMLGLAKAAGSTSQKVANAKQQQDLPPKIIKRSLDFVPAKIEFYMNGKLVRTESVNVIERTQPLVLKLVGGIPLSREDNPQAFDQYSESSGICITGHDRNKKTLRYEESFIFTMQTPAIELQISWYGDGEQEFPIMINGAAGIFSPEGSNKKDYWKDSPVADVICTETGSTLSEHDALFLDGGGSALGSNAKASANYRIKDGIAEAKKQAPLIFSKLKKNTEGKIIQRIQVYTHSRGSVYGNAFITQLRLEIQNQKALFENPDDVIDSVFHLDPHQPDFIRVVPSNFPTVAIAHDQSMLGGIEKMEGDVLGIETDNRTKHTFDSAISEFARAWKGEVIESPSQHSLNTFAAELSSALEQHNENNYYLVDDKYKGIEERFKDKTVTINRPE